MSQITFDELRERFKHHPPTNEKIGKHQDIRQAMLDAAFNVVDLVPEGREQALALTKLEEAMFWANAGIARGA